MESRSRWIVSCAVTALLAWAVAGCALRPRYQDMISAGQATQDQVTVVFTDPATGAPISGMEIALGEGRDRVVATTDAHGRVTLPRTEALEAANPLVVVRRPAGVTAYQFAAPDRAAPAPGAQDTAATAEPSPDDMPIPSPPTPDTIGGTPPPASGAAMDGGTGVQQ